MAYSYVAKRFNNVSVNSLKDDLRLLKEAIALNQTEIDKLNTSIDDTSWKCSSKYTLKNKINNFTSKYHQDVLSKIQKCEGVIELVEKVQDQYILADNAVNNLNKIESSNLGEADDVVKNQMEKLNYENQLRVCKEFISNYESQIENLYS